MSCKCAIPTDEYHGWECSVTGGACMFFSPNAKACAEEYGEGPETEDSKCKECKYRNRVINQYPCNKCENDNCFEKASEYKNEDKKCQCWKCELSKTCPYKDKYQRLPRTVPGALGLCKKL